MSLLDFLVEVSSCFQRRHVGEGIVDLLLAIAQIGARGFPDLGPAVTGDIAQAFQATEEMVGVIGTVTEAIEKDSGIESEKETSENSIPVSFEPSQRKTLYRRVRPYGSDKKGSLRDSKTFKDSAVGPKKISNDGSGVDTIDIIDTPRSQIKFK